ncbi:Condensin complex subunit 2 [Quillaja saponaria]|uniref:Condensin complex subunit 2 n=1 Tax=Quillaja saponaria TaxID=32244 RepID=A0AAD7LVE4_QUISA|nr:Condensin complex subunit 2 [Quillaja saponaria]
MTSKLQSPTSPFFLGSNDDQLERAQARAARAAALRRKAATADVPQSPTNPGLSDEQVSELFRNCIKLASENKINQKNTWELKLIDHLSEIIKVDAVNDSETNFQKASCTLEAGVKIYSVRVDAVHSEAYKVLSRMNRAGLEDEQETIAQADDANGQQGWSHARTDPHKKISPLSTLESSFEVLNAKKFDVAFVVDPLYHRTSSQFDEGGAKGLLLNNLGVYGGCHVLFDSFEVPGKCKSSPVPNDYSDMIDLLFAKESIEQIVITIPTTTDISPTLKEIVSQSNEHDQSLSPTASVSQESDLRADAFDSVDNNVFGNCDGWTSDHYDDANVVYERNSSSDPSFQGYNQDNDPYTLFEPDVDDRIEQVALLLLPGLRIPSKQNAWAGPDHWKYWRAKGQQGDPVSECQPTFSSKRAKNKKIEETDTVFMDFLDKKLTGVFASPRNAKSILLPASRGSLSNKLPEDCHYQPENLVKLFLLPNILCLGKRRRKTADDNTWQQNIDIDEALPSWDNESGLYDDVCVHSDVESCDGLISQPHQVNKIEVQYDNTSKKVDVHVLKGILWDKIEESNDCTQSACNDMISFKHLLATFPLDCPAAPEDISPHMCFICLLHLANEHGLKINDCPDQHRPNPLEKEKLTHPI